MAAQHIHAVYAKAVGPLWVTPYDAGQSLRVLNYSPAVITELSEWMARRLSMSVAAGYLGLKPEALKLGDVCRLLLKARRECERPTPGAIPVGGLNHLRRCVPSGSALHPAPARLRRTWIALRAAYSG